VAGVIRESPAFNFMIIWKFKNGGSITMKETECDEAFQGTNMDYFMMAGDDELDGDISQDNVGLPDDEVLDTDDDDDDDELDELDDLDAEGEDSPEKPKNNDE
jgi:hypothetical protein